MSLASSTASFRPTSSAGFEAGSHPSSPCALLHRPPAQGHRREGAGHPASRSCLTQRSTAQCTVHPVHLLSPPHCVYCLRCCVCYTGRHFAGDARTTAGGGESGGHQRPLSVAFALASPLLPGAGTRLLSCWIGEASLKRWRATLTRRAQRHGAKRRHATGDHRRPPGGRWLLSFEHEELPRLLPRQFSHGWPPAERGIERSGQLAQAVAAAHSGAARQQGARWQPAEEVAS